MTDDRTRDFDDEDDPLGMESVRREVVRRHRSRSEYFMNIAMAVRERANCKGSRVGAVLVYENRIIATGYNGTPEDMLNCEDGGCDRCANRDKYASGSAYDVCICVHAEQNCLLSAARHGIPVWNSTLYTTTRPCFGCAKELLQAKVQSVFYLHAWTPADSALLPEYEKLLYRIPRGIRRVDMLDPDKEWAVRPGAPLEDTGHSIPATDSPPSEGV